MRRLAGNIDRTRTVALFGNRVVHGGVDDVESSTPGGQALRFYSSVRLALHRGERLSDETGAFGTVVKMTTVKNKVAPPLRTTDLRQVYGQGFVTVTDPAIDQSQISR